MSKKINFRAGQIAYEVMGKGRAMVLLHGFLESKEIWKTIQNSLSKSFKVIAIDLPAHGESSTFGYVNSMEEMANAVKAVLDELKLRKYVLVGHSMGGYVALAFGEKYADHLLAMVLFHSTAKADSMERKESRRQMIQLVKRQKQKIIPTLIQSLFNTEIKTYKRAINKIQKQAIRMDSRAIIATIEGMMRRKEREIILKFAPYPILYIIGEKDAVLSANILIEESKIAEKSGLVVLKDCGHMGMIEKEKDSIFYLKKFGKQLRSERID